MDEGEYDEFGNYIGGGLDDDEDNSSIDDTGSRLEDRDDVSVHSRVEPDWDDREGGPAPPFDGDVVMDESDGTFSSMACFACGTGSMLCRRWTTRHSS